MKNFTFYWKTGQREVFKGKNPADALNNAGYGAGALGALDFYAIGVDKDYTWDAQKKEWIRNKPL